MASGTTPSTSQIVDRPPTAPPTKHEALIDRRLSRTRQQLKSVDIAIGLLILAAGSLVYLLAAAVADHWLVPGGFGPAARILLFAGLVVLAGFFFTRRVLPFLVHRVNPLYAAQIIEQGRPSLKNGLLNLLFLRRDPESVESSEFARHVLQGLERNAAAELEQLPEDGTVDNSKVIRLSYVLVAILAICALYLVLSPKNLFASFSRVILPWADIKPPTRVTFESIEPGDSVAYQGDMVTVSAEVKGLRQDEKVLLYHTTADGQTVDQAIPMTVPEQGYRHRCQLPPSAEGLQQEVAYHLSAGDCRSPRYTIKVGVPPTIVVNEVHYDYPDYTGLVDRVDRQTGDIQAIEGTRITIRATANLPIAHASMEMNGDPRQMRAMTAEGDQATGEVALRMRQDDPSRPQYESYQIRFTDRSRRENRRPTRHRIRVIPDLAPEVALVDPPPEKVEIPVDGSLDLRVRAEDPDFALRRVRLRAERGAESLKIRPLLNKSPPEPAHEGKFESSYRFRPAGLGLKAGDEVIYWAEAEDNKEVDDEPSPNRASTSRRWILVTASESVEPQEGTPQQSTPETDRPAPGEPDKHQENADRGQQEGQSASTEEKSEDPNRDSKPRGGEREPQADDAQDMSQEGQESSKQEQPGQEGGASGASGEQDASESQSDSDTSQGEGQDGQQSGKEGQQRESGAESGRSEGTGEESQGEAADQQGAQKGQDDGSGSQSGGTESSQSGQTPDQESGETAESINPETDPGEAIERILEHRTDEQPDGGQTGQESDAKGQPEDAQEGDEPGSQTTRPSATEPQGGTETSGERDQQGESGKGDSNTQPETDGTQTPEQGSEGSDQQSTSGQSETSPQEQSDQAGPSGRQPDESESGESESKTESKQDGGAEGSNQQEPSEKSAGKQCDNPDCKDGSCAECQGKSGAGQSSGESSGSPEPQQTNTPRDKQQGTEGQPRKPGKEESAQSPSGSPKQSDSESDTRGDKSGGGEEGGGQKADRPGEGTPGMNAPSDQEGAPSNEQGEGETGPNAGDQVPADRPTGSPASEAEGPGSEQRPQPSARQPGEEPQPQQGLQESGEPANSDPSGVSQQQGGDPNVRRTGGPRSPTGGGAPGDQPPRPSTQQPPPGTDRDEGNLEYARKQTELALEHLDEQLAEEDSDLLDRLGWTRQDAERFLRKWQAMKQAAGSEGVEGTEARRELDETIRGLGLRPQGTQLESDSVTRHLRGVRDSRRFDPPAEWAEMVNEYKKSIASGQRNPR